MGQARGESPEVERRAEVVTFGPVERAVGEWDLARVRRKPAQQTGAGCWAAWPGPRQPPQAPQGLGAQREGGCTVRAPRALGPLGCWPPEDWVGVGPERSGLSRRSGGGMGLWVWERYLEQMTQARILHGLGGKPQTGQDAGGRGAGSSTPQGEGPGGGSLGAPEERRGAGVWTNAEPAV